MTLPLTIGGGGVVGDQLRAVLHYRPDGVVGKDDALVLSFDDDGTEAYELHVPIVVR